MILKELAKPVPLDEVMKINVFKKEITVRIKILKYENLTFKAYDYPMRSELLNNYKIENIFIRHEENYIIITCGSEDIFIGVNIFFYKYSLLSYPEDVTLSIQMNNEEETVTPNYDEILKKCTQNKSNVYFLKIKSKSYDLRKENGIIVYYDSDYLYNNEILNRIIDQL